MRLYYKILIFISAAIGLTACDEDNMRSYEKNDITFISAEASAGEVKIYFSAMMETLFHCPGANIHENKEGISLEFVRCPINSKCNVSHPAKRDESGLYVVVKSNAQIIFLKLGSSTEQVYPNK
jgi:hypothetical protein